MLKSDIVTETSINYLRTYREDLSWVGIEVEGTNIIVKVSKANKLEEISEDEVCNVVSDKYGVITKISAQAGTINVSVGDVVKVGDILINRIYGRNIYWN